MKGSRRYLDRDHAIRLVLNDLGLTAESSILIAGLYDRGWQLLPLVADETNGMTHGIGHSHPVGLMRLIEAARSFDSISREMSKDGPEVRFTAREFVDWLAPEVLGTLPRPMTTAWARPRTWDGKLRGAENHHPAEDMKCAVCEMEWPCQTYLVARDAAEERKRKSDILKEQQREQRKAEKSGAGAA